MTRVVCSACTKGRKIIIYLETFNFDVRHDVVVSTGKGEGVGRRENYVELVIKLMPTANGKQTESAEGACDIIAVHRPDRSLLGWSPRRASEIALCVAVHKNVI